MRFTSIKKALCALASLCYVAQGSAASLSWDGGGTNSLWSTTNNWSSNTFPANGDDVTFGTAFTSGTSIGLNGNRTVNSLTINTVTGFSLTNNTLTLTSGNLTRNDVAGTEANQTIYSGIDLGNNGTWTVNGSGTLLVAGNVSKTYRSLTFDGSGNLTISGIISGGYTTTTKNGTGTLTLTGANTFDGLMIINSGVVNVQNNTALGTPTYNNVVASGAALELQGGITLNESQFSLAGTGIAGGGALRSVSGNNTFAGTLNYAAATTVAADSGTLSLLGPQSLDNSVTYTGSGNIILSNTIYGGGELIKSGSGTLTFMGNDGVSYGGGTRINEGTVVLNKSLANSFNSAFIVGDGTNTDTLRLGASDQIANHLLMTVNSSGVFNLNGFNETIAGVTLDGGQITTGTGTLTLGGNSPITTLSNSATATITGKLAITANSAVISVADGSAATDLNIVANTTVSDGLVKSGAGTMKLTGTVSAGSTQISINSGTILLGSANRISDSTGISLNGGTFATGGFNETVGILTLSSTSTIDMGDGSSVLAFANSGAAGWSGTLTIQNWSGSLTGGGTDRLIFGSSASGLTAAQISQIRFENPTGLVGTYTAKILANGEIVPVGPVPEPSTVFALFLIGGGILFHERKRLKAIFVKASQAQFRTKRSQ